MTSDLDLLRQFAREHSQDAFGEIVRRHVNLVYSAALRQVRSPHLAEDVTQSVFADLARDAHKLKPDTILTAWLYTVARRTAIDAVRTESRRQLREQIAMEMTLMNATADDWAQIAPLLDDAMAALDETDRTAVLLRYFENKSLRDVGASLNISDDAAQKRVSRAVESLREFFTKQRVAVGASALVILLSANAVKAAPAHLTGTITTLVTTSTIGMTMMHKILIAGMTAAAVGATVYAVHLQSQVKSLLQQNTSLNGQIAQLQQELADATNQLGNLQEQNGQLQSGQEELLRLRGEVTRLLNRHNDQGNNTPAETNSSPRSTYIGILTAAKFISVPSEDVPAMGVEWTSSDSQGGKTGLLSKEQFKAITEALKDASDATTLSAPRVVTVNGMGAQISTTQTIPINGTNADIGEKLFVMPYYSTNSSEFNLGLNAKISFLTGDPVQPDFQSQQITNQVAVSPGQTVVLETEMPAGAWQNNPTNISTGAQSILVFITPTAIDAAGNRLFH
jgi:RNA polymerase sigma factor (sigma-70 family)